MKNIIIALCLLGSLVIILSSIDFGEALALFLLAGVIPGTNIAISPAETLLLCGLTASIVVARITAPQIVKLIPKKSIVSPAQKA